MNKRIMISLFVSFHSFVIMWVRQVLISAVVAVAINLLLTSDAFFIARVVVTQKLVAVTRTFLVHRFFPDGLLSIGALLIIRDYLKDQLQQMGSYIKLKLTFRQ